MCRSLRGNQSYCRGGVRRSISKNTVPEAGDTMPGPPLALRRVTGHGNNDQNSRAPGFMPGPDAIPASGGSRRPGRPSNEDQRGASLHVYLISIVAPASSNFFLIVAASSLETASLMVAGADSTRSLASLRPRLVTSRTALMTLIFFSPAAFSTTSNSVGSSTGAAAAAPPPDGAATAAAAAETP